MWKENFLNCQQMDCDCLSHILTNGCKARIYISPCFALANTFTPFQLSPLDKEGLTRTPLTYFITSNLQNKSNWVIVIS